MRNGVWPSPGAGCLIPTEIFKLKRLHLLVIYFLKKLKKPLGPTKSISPISNCESFKFLNVNILKAITTSIIRVLYLPLTTGYSERHLISYFDAPVYQVPGM